jgi:hypothetical protein
MAALAKPFDPVWCQIWIEKKRTRSSHLALAPRRIGRVILKLSAR